LSRFLGLDWDNDQLYVVSGTTGRGGLRVSHAAAWSQPLPRNAVEAEAVGKRLRDFLKAAHIPPAPVLACVSRERVVLKELRYPRVPPADEPQMVRFQAEKELTEAAQGLVIDYVPREDAPAANGERRTFTYVVRRDLLGLYQTVCRAAGLKLLAVAPRSFGIAACLRRGLEVGGAHLPDLLPGAVAVLAVTDRSAEMCVVRGDNVLFSRALSPGKLLPGEVRRNLALYAAQLHGGASPDAVKAVYLASDGEHAPTSADDQSEAFVEPIDENANGNGAPLREKLHEQLGMPVLPLDPFSREKLPGLGNGHRGGYTAAVGLLEAWTERKTLPINFLAPKEPKPQEDPNRKRLIFGGAAVAAVFALGFFVAASWLMQVWADERKLQGEAARLDAALKNSEADRVRIEALRVWEYKHKVSILDELYDLTKKFPWIKDVRVTQLEVKPIVLTVAKVPGGAKTPPPKATEQSFLVRVDVQGVVPSDKKQLIPALRAAIETIDGGLHKAYLIDMKLADASTGGKGNTYKFHLEIHVPPRALNEYTAVLGPAPPPLPPETAKTMKGPGKGKGKGGF
jgi:hypothetical protein